MGPLIDICQIVRYIGALKEHKVYHWQVRETPKLYERLFLKTFKDDRKLILALIYCFDSILLKHSK
jgi:hypothetical protein